MASVQEVKCPSCGGPARVADDCDIATCEYCGSTLHVSFRTVETGFEADGTIRDKSTGQGIFRVGRHGGWQVLATELRRTGCISRPYVPRAGLKNRENGVVEMAMGDAGMRMSAGLKAMMGMYGGHLAGIDTANYAEMPNPLLVADKLAEGKAAELAATSFRLVGQMAAGNIDAALRQDFEAMQRSARAEGAAVQNPFEALVLRVYDFTYGGNPWRMAAYVRMHAAKSASNVGEGFTGGLGGLLGGLFGGKRQTESIASPAQRMPQQGVPWCTADFGAYAQSGTIMWSTVLQALFMAPAAVFDEQLASSFMPLVGTLQIHPDVESLSLQESQQYSARVQQATQSQLARNQAAFEAQQAAHRRRQAAFDSYIQSVNAASDAHHRQFMASSNAQFEHRAPDFSEAIRGVNTYATADGREIEISVSADHAWENQAGDVIGTSGSYEPGADWTELPRL